MDDFDDDPRFTVKTLLSAMFALVALAVASNAAKASIADCDAVCTCAVPCEMACVAGDTSQSTTCGEIGLACVVACPDSKLDMFSAHELPLYSDEELVCR